MKMSAICKPRLIITSTITVYREAGLENLPIPAVPPNPELKFVFNELPLGSNTFYS
jgi:hypothetical protein